MPLFIPEYELVPVHKLMLSDKIRTNAFCKALEERTNVNDIVIDFGSGTGILSLAAAKAGARRVYAIERTGIAYVADRLFKKNHLSEKISLLIQDSTEVIIPESVNLIVSEWIGVHVFQENMLFDLIEIRDRFLSPNGVLIPETVSIWIAPLKMNPIISDEVLKWQEPIEGFDFSEIFELSLNDVYITRVSPEDLAASGVSTETLDLYSVQRFDDFQIKAKFIFDSPQTITGICGWFSAQLTENVTLDTSPNAPATHWCQTVYPIYPEIAVQSGETLELDLKFEPVGRYVNITWRAAVEGREKETCRTFSTKNNYTLPGSS